MVHKSTDRRSNEPDKPHPTEFAITLLAKSPVPVGSGGDILNGRIYFASGSHVYGYSVPD